jgi:hypothetical protein
MREQKRLRQKYQNVLRQLEHEQRMETNHVMWRIEKCIDC